MRDVYLESRFLVIAGDRMSRGLRQKEKSDWERCLDGLPVGRGQ